MSTQPKFKQGQAVIVRGGNETNQASVTVKATVLAAWVDKASGLTHCDVETEQGNRGRFDELHIDAA